MLTAYKYYESAEKYYSSGSYRKALRFFKKAYSRRPSEGCLNYMACCMMELEEYAAAVKLFAMLIRNNPNWQVPALNLGKLYFKLGEMSKAKKFLETAYFVNSKDEDTAYNLAVYHFENADFNEAKKYFERALEINDSNSEVHLYLGMCFFKLDLYEEALREFDLTYKYDNKCSNAIENQGLVYIAMKNYVSALDKFLMLNKMETNNVQNMVDISHCFYKIGNFKNALIWVNKALNLEPNNEIAIRLKELVKSGR